MSTQTTPGAATPELTTPQPATAGRSTTAGPAGGIAARLEDALRPLLGGRLPVRLHAWDGSVAGPRTNPGDAPVVRLKSPEALRRMLWSPGELGAAQAYVTGALDVEGDLDAALSHAWQVAAARGLSGRSNRNPRGAAALAGALRTAYGVLRDSGSPVGPLPPPATQAALPRFAPLHTLRRDRAAIAHHYDLSNDFYAQILDPSMAYSCGYYESPSMGLADAQRAKLDLVCRKLGLEPGMRMLDVGCGWGSLTLHAAEQYGALVTAVTISAEQHRFVADRVRERGLADRVDVRLQDYRRVTVPEEGPWDAVGSLEMGEHVGRRSYPTYVETLRRAVRPGGRVLVQQMSRAGRHPGGGPFIESFIAPDMYMRPVGETVSLIESGGLEVRDVHALREHYVRTVDGWWENFVGNRETLLGLVGEEMVRVWELYLVGGRMAFRDGRMGVDQILAVRPGGVAGHAGGRAEVRTW